MSRRIICPPTGTSCRPVQEPVRGPGLLQRGGSVCHWPYALACQGGERAGDADILVAAKEADRSVCRHFGDVTGLEPLASQRSFAKMSAHRARGRGERGVVSAGPHPHIAPIRRGFVQTSALSGDMSSSAALSGRLAPQASACPARFIRAGWVGNAGVSITDCLCNA